MGTLLTTHRAVRSDPGGSERLRSVVRVINVPQLAAEMLEREQRFVRAAFGYMRDLVIVCDPKGNVILINHAMETFAGLDPVGVLPELISAYYELSQPDGTPVASGKSPMEQALRGELVHDVEMVVTSGAGRQSRMIADGEQLCSADGAVLGAIVVWRDITEQRVAEERLAFHALHDTLTGLPNRDLFIDRLRTALVRAPRYGWSTAVLAINLDHFADLAIRLGDGSADKLLLEVAQRLEVTLRPYDSVARPVDTLARLGGDRFLLLCEDIADEAAATAVANRIEVMLNEPLEIGSDVVRLSAAIGITITRDPDHDPETLILEAETAMRRSRTRGSGRHEPFAPEMRAALRARFADEEALRLALVTEQFSVAYQPKVSLVTEHIVGVEALLRWNHPERGLVSPLDFIPLAEESGLIVADRRMGARSSMPGRHAVAEVIARRPTAHGRRQRLAPSVRVGPRRGVRQHHRCRGHRSQDCVPRGHREHGHAGRRDGDHDVARAQIARTSTSRSTISAQASHRSRTSNAFRSTS